VGGRCCSVLASLCTGAAVRARDRARHPPATHGPGLAWRVRVRDGGETCVSLSRALTPCWALRRDGRRDEPHASMELHQSTPTECAPVLIKTWFVSADELYNVLVYTKA
jgi:hypothetical protein